jgi:hypothetical protein
MKLFPSMLFVWYVWCLAAAAQEPATTFAPSLPGLTPPALTAKLHPADDDDNRAVRQSLEKRISVQLEKIPLRDAMRQLAGQLDVTIWLDPKGLEEASVTPDELVSLQLPSARARNALHLLLEPLHLTTLVRDGVLKITSQEKASESLGTRVYNVRDLVDTTRRGAGAAPMPVPEGTKVYYRGAAPSGYIEDYDTLIDLITSTVQPDSWTDNGGSGSISGFPSGLLVISQTDDYQEEVERLLTMMRAALGKVGATLPER